MAEQKGSFLSRFLKRLLIFLLIVVFIATGGYLFVRFYYGVDLITTFSHFGKLSKAVTVEETITARNTFATTANAKLGVEYIRLTEDGYRVNTEVDGTLSETWTLTDKEVGALVDVLLLSSEANKIALADVEVPFHVVQMNFSNFAEGGADVNVIVKLDLTKLKEAKFSKFPLKLLVGYIPNDLYISATVKVTHGENAFDYTISGGALAINGLDQKETDSLFNDIKRIFKSTSTAADIAQRVATPIFDGLIGPDADHKGFVQVYGTDFAFVAGAEDAVNFNIMH